MTTYPVLTTGHWIYLVCWHDAFSRRVVGWHVSDSLYTDMILPFFNRAVAICQPSSGPLVHADRSDNTPNPQSLYQLALPHLDHYQSKPAG